MKHILLVLKIQNGEYEYFNYSVHKVRKNSKKEKFADKYSKEFYGDTKTYPIREKGDGGYYHHGGCVATEVYRVVEITEEEYKVLNKHVTF